MPFKQEKLSDTCICCGKPAAKMVYWGPRILMLVIDSTVRLVD